MKEEQKEAEALYAWRADTTLDTDEHVGSADVVAKGEASTVAARPKSTNAWCMAMVELELVMEKRRRPTGAMVFII